MSVLHPATFKEFRPLMCLWQAFNLWKKQLEVRSLNVTWRRDLWGQEVNIFRQCLKCIMNSYEKFPAWKGLNSQPKSSRSTTEERRRRRKWLRTCCCPSLPPFTPPPQTVSDAFPILAFDRLSLLLRRRCQAARPPRTYSTGQVEACYLQIGKGYTRSFKCA